MKKNYRITCQGFVVEGKANSTHNACRLAFKELIRAGLIKKQPPTDPNSPTTFRDTKVEIIGDD